MKTIEAVNVHVRFKNFSVIQVHKVFGKSNMFYEWTSIPFTRIKFKRADLDFYVNNTLLITNMKKTFDIYMSGYFKYISVKRIKFAFIGILIGYIIALTIGMKDVERRLSTEKEINIKQSIDLSEVKDKWEKMEALSIPVSNSNIEK